METDLPVTSSEAKGLSKKFAQDQFYIGGFTTSSKAQLEDKMKLTFEKGTAEYIVESFGKEIDDKGYVINPETGERVQHRGRDVTKENLAIIEDGSDIFVDDSFDSLSEHVERARE